MKENLNKLKELIKTQTSPGNWDYDPYMHGMANGMLLAEAIMEDREPEYLNAPKVWGKDKPKPSDPVVITGSDSRS